MEVVVQQELQRVLSPTIPAHDQLLAIKRLRREHPADSQEIKEVYDCYQSGHTADACLAQVTSGEQQPIKVLGSSTPRDDKVQGQTQDATTLGTLSPFSIIKSATYLFNKKCQ